MRKFPFSGLVALALTLGAALLVTGTSLAQQPTPSDDAVNAIAKQLYCPVCENIPLDVCPTQACAQWRDLIREKLAAGWSERQIKDYFVEQYGDRVLGTPPTHGLNWFVYVSPPVAILAGAYILYSVLNSWRNPTGSGAKLPIPPPADEYVSRLEEEVRKR
jgi:cytochrome c-type biogenesis protein CcmH